MFSLLSTIITTAVIFEVQGFCGDSIRWSRNFNIDHVYGVWYGVGYAQHTPDMTNKPNEVGCVTLYLTDATNEVRDDWLDWSIDRRNYTNPNWRSYKSNPWSENPMSGSWMDIRMKRIAKRATYAERRMRVMWDEDGQTLEQTYVYTIEEPGLWTLEQWRPREREMLSRGNELWYPDDPPRHPEVIRVLKVSPQVLIVNHCSDMGDGGMFSLVLRRSPSRVDRWEWYDLKRQFYSFNLPNLYRYMSVCSGCMEMSSVLHILVCIVLSRILSNI